MQVYQFILLVTIISAVFYFFTIWGAISQNTDPDSFSNFNDIAVTNLKLSLDFQSSNSVVYGIAVLELKNLNHYTRTIELDTRQLQISSITHMLNGTEIPLIWKESTYLTMGYLGCQINIPLPKIMENGELIYIKIKYSFNKKSFGLAYFTEGYSNLDEIIYTSPYEIVNRALIPSQDSPGVRFTSEINITVHSSMKVIATGILNSISGSENITTYCFRNDIPLPSYQLGFFIGKRVKIAISEKINVYADPTTDISFINSLFENADKWVENVETMFNMSLPVKQISIVIANDYLTYDTIGYPYFCLIKPTNTSKLEIKELIFQEVIKHFTSYISSTHDWKDEWILNGFRLFIIRDRIALSENITYSNQIAILGNWTMTNEIKQIGVKNTYTSLISDTVISHTNHLQNEKSYQMYQYISNLITQSELIRFMLGFLKNYQYKCFGQKEFILAFNYFVNGNYFNNFLDTGNGEINLRPAWIVEPGYPIVKLNMTFQNYEKIIQIADHFLNVQKKKIVPVELGDIKDESDINKMIFLEYLRFNSQKLDETALGYLEYVIQFNSATNLHLLKRWVQLIVDLQSLSYNNTISRFLCVFTDLDESLKLWTKIVSYNNDLAKSIYARCNSNYNYMLSFHIKEFSEPTIEHPLFHIALDNYYLQGCIEDELFHDTEYIPKHPEEFDHNCYKKIGDRALCIICNCSILWLTEWNLKAHSRSNKHIANCKARIAFYNKKIKATTSEYGPSTWKNRSLEDNYNDGNNHDNGRQPEWNFVKEPRLPDPSTSQTPFQTNIQQPQPESNSILSKIHSETPIQTFPLLPSQDNSVVNMKLEKLLQSHEQVLKTMNEIKETQIQLQNALEEAQKKISTFQPQYQQINPINTGFVTPQEMYNQLMKQYQNSFIMNQMLTRKSVEENRVSNANN